MTCVTKGPSSSRLSCEAALWGLKSYSHTMAQGCPPGPLQVPPAEWQYVGSATGEMVELAMDFPDIRQTCWWQHAWAKRSAESLAAQPWAWCQQDGKPVSNAHNALSFPGVWDEGLPHCGTKSKWERDASIQSLRAVQSCTGWSRLAALLPSKE